MSTTTPNLGLTLPDSGTTEWDGPINGNFSTLDTVIHQLQTEVSSGGGSGTGATGPAGPTGPAGLTWRGPWNANTAYAVDDAVSYNGSSYIATHANTNAEPDVNTASWGILALQGAEGPTGPQGQPGSGGGSGATLPTATASGQFIVSSANQGYWDARVLQASDIPNNAANTTGTAANVSGTVAIANGGTGETTAAAALRALGGVSAAGDTMTGNLTVPTVNATGATSINATGVVNAGSVSTSGAVASGSLSTGNATVTGTLTANTINATANIKVNGTVLASSNLSDGANLAKLNTAQSFTAAQTMPTGNITTVNATTVNATSVNASGAVSAASYTASGDITTATSHVGTATVSGTLTANTINATANFTAGTQGARGALKYVQADGQSFIGIYDTTTSTYYGISPQAVVIPGVVNLGGYWAGFAVTGTASWGSSGTSSTTFMVQTSDSHQLMAIQANGNLSVAGSITGTTKNFSIPYPGDSTKTLVHSSLEGPEIAVFYRGEGQLQNGTATITPPAYFEALTQATGRTVMLTPMFDSTEAISSLAASAVANGQFTVRAVDTNNSSQKFYWEVKAVRADQPNLEVIIDNSTTTQAN